MSEHERLTPEMFTPEAVRKMTTKQLKRAKRQMAEEMANLDSQEAQLRAELRRRLGPVTNYMQRFPQR